MNPDLRRRPFCASVFPWTGRVVRAFEALWKAEQHEPNRRTMCPDRVSADPKRTATVAVRVIVAMRLRGKLRLPCAPPSGNA